MLALPQLPAFSGARLHLGQAGANGLDFVRSKTVELAPADTQAIASLWSQLAECKGGGMRCYTPAYELSLWSGGVECFSAAFCWRCQWIRFRHADRPAEMFAWSSKCPEATALFDLFDARLPLANRPNTPGAFP